MATPKAQRLARAGRHLDGKVLDTSRTTEVLEVVIEPGDRVALEGNNQKQADFLSRSLAAVDPGRVHGLHMVMSCLTRPEHLDLFEDGIGERVDFAYSGPQSLRTAQLMSDGILQVGAIHTYLELYSRMFLDLYPQVALVAAEQGDAQGNLYTGPNTEDTPVVTETAAFRGGLVIAQVNELVQPGELPRVDIPGSWVDVVVQADRPYQLEALFTRDPRQITDLQILLAMLAIRGVYEPHQVTSLNHGIGFNTAAIELLLPTYGEQLGLKGKICRNFALNPHPSLIPAIESGWVHSIAPFGGEVGMADYVAAHPEIFPIGPDGSLRSNRMGAQAAGLYANDMFIGSTLQMDRNGDSSTVTSGRISGFGGAPNLGFSPGGRRHSSPAWLNLAEEPGGRGQKLVVQILETFGGDGVPHFVESLDAVQVGRDAGLDVTPVMIYGDDVTHVVTEQGVARLYRCRDLEERRAAVAWAAGATELGRSRDRARDAELQRAGVVAPPEELGVRRTDARRSLLAARSVEDLVEWSGGRYQPPSRFRSW